MSRGTPIVTLRMSEQEQKEIDRAIRSANRSRMEEPYTRTSWILAAVRQKLQHMERAKKKKKGTKSCTAPATE